jgi:signal transduction histidine kinase/CheY-like chemotaxis protein
MRIEMSEHRLKSPSSSVVCSKIGEQAEQRLEAGENKYDANYSISLLESVANADFAEDDQSTRDASSCSLLSSLYRKGNSSAATLWNESDEDESDRVEADKFPLLNIRADASVASASTLSNGLDHPRHGCSTHSTASRVSKGEMHISSRLERYGIVKRNQALSKMPASQIHTAPLHVQVAVEEVHRWLFVEGGHFEDVQSLMTEYSNYIRNEFGIPLDRLYFGGLGLHPKLTAYLWRWEPDDFEHREMPQEIFERRNELFSPDEPFCILEQGRADFVRIRDTDEYIPPDTEKWFRAGGYKDYFALPDIHRGQSKGGLAWSTKRPGGFSDDDIQFFRLTQPALTTIMRLHTNDLVLKTLTERMEREIEDRTTELAMANQKLERANNHISQQSSNQLEHFACMSHEIRTPLNCILGMSSLLVDSHDFPEAYIDSIKMIHGSADLLSGVVDDVLDYAKLESGNFEVDIQPTDLQSALDSVVHSISNKSEEKKVSIRTSYCGMLPRTVNTDGRRLQQILFNLLGNASKFSREGTSIDFSVKILKEPNRNKLRLSIKDYGKGIAAKDFESIFRPFSQASKETQTVYGGTGLGLSITSKLVAKLGGNITVNSELGRYAEFVVELPYDGELVDLATFKDKFADTTLVIIDEAEMCTETYSMEDEFVPLPCSVTQSAGLNVMRSPNWTDLDRKLTNDDKTGHFVFIVHQDMIRESYIDRIKKILGAEKCSWLLIGEGIAGDHQVHHIRCLSQVFPSILLETIHKVVSSDRKRPSILSSKFASEKKKQDKAPTPQSLSRPLKVLYAEDNVVNQKVLQRVLERLGLNDITIVDNGLKAVESCETNRYDLIFMDMQMPVMDGVEACKKIVARNATEKVVFVTAHALEDFKEKALAAGAVDFVSKPFNLQKIRAILKSTVVK